MQRSKVVNLQAATLNFGVRIYPSTMHIESETENVF